MPSRSPGAMVVTGALQLVLCPALVLGLGEDHAAARSAQRLGWGGGNDVSDAHRARIEARGDQSGIVRDVGHQHGIDLVGDVAQALGGVINLVSKPPTGRSEALLNRRTMGVTDAATWLSWRLSESSGWSLLMSGTMQSDADPDDDGWTDQPRAERWGVRPRLPMRRSAWRSSGWSCA